MKFKLGLMVGGAAGYLLGSGKGAEMWSDYRARSAGSLSSGANSVLDFSEPEVVVLIEDNVSTSEAPLNTDR
jgi:hypothetical protein